MFGPLQQAHETGGVGVRPAGAPFIQSADLYRLVHMFPDFHSATLHRILAYCHGDLKRAIDHTLFARQLRVIDSGPPAACGQPMSSQPMSGQPMAGQSISGQPMGGQSMGMGSQPFQQMPLHAHPQLPSAHHSPYRISRG